MSDTKALEALNAEIVELVDELGSMQTKQERLKDLMRQRSELEQRLLGVASDGGARPAGRRRTNAASAPGAVAAD
jgi:cell division FtsZ-interacting protein ZapD